MKKFLFTGLLLAPVMLFAQVATTSTSTPPPRVLTTNVACTDVAIDKRENALIAGHDAMNTAIKNALEARKVALKDAWAQTDRKVRNEKRTAAWKTFKNSSQSAHTNMRNARKAAWQTFDTDMRACGIRFHGETPNVVSAPTSSL